jgi:hypothetical protein
MPDLEARLAAAEHKARRGGGAHVLNQINPNRKDHR